MSSHGVATPNLGSGAHALKVGKGGSPSGRSVDLLPRAAGSRPLIP
jgi:hypothetical protein